MEGLTKTQKRRLKDLASIAHERELTAALEELEASFSEWREGGIDPFELDQRIHSFKKGPARNIWITYSGVDAAVAVARGLGQGFLEESEVDELLRAILARQIEYFGSETE